jgi:hypothetical protein
MRQPTEHLPANQQDSFLYFWGVFHALIDQKEPVIFSKKIVKNIGKTQGKRLYLLAGEQ